MLEDDLQNLVKKLKASDHDAFKMIFDRFQQHIFHFLYFKTKDEALAEDMLQEVFLKCWNARHNLDETRSLRNYLYTIADNLVLNHIRHGKVMERHRDESQASETSNLDNPQFILEEKEWHVRLRKAIDDLPEKPRIVFLMSRMEDLSYQEIADRLTLSVKTVESHMTKALKILREKLSKKL
jgi:RNA polymerase sigma-70 factor (family 1)